MRHANNQNWKQIIHANHTHNEKNINIQIKNIIVFAMQIHTQNVQYMHPANMQQSTMTTIPRCIQQICISVMQIHTHTDIHTEHAANIQTCNACNKHPKLKHTIMQITHMHSTKYKHKKQPLKLQKPYIHPIHLHIHRQQT